MRRRHSIQRATAVLILSSGSLWAAAQSTDPDRDQDGLSDFQETHKYRTDPARADSDGDGRPDGDWDERREYTYTITSVVRILPPADVGAANDDFQDARLIEATDEYVELEVVHYPFNTAGEAIVADPKWRPAARRLRPFTQSTTTSNFDSAMSRALGKEIEEEAGVDLDQLDDKSLVEHASRRLMARAKFEDGFTTFMADFEDGKAVIPPELREAARRQAQRAGRSIEEQWERELFARGMFEHRVHGSCTSSAIYLCGGLRAVGVPTRIVLVIPLIDANDPAEIEMVEEGIRHHRARHEILKGLRGIVGSWASHTFNEVFVGGRWRRLNYTRLGQPTLDASLYGLTTHILTVRDWSEARMGRTVGLRQNSAGGRDDLFGYANPYSTLRLWDEFGEHAEIDNPPFEGPQPLRVVPIRRAFWAASDERPGHLNISRVDLEYDRHHIVLEADAAQLESERGEFDKPTVDDFWKAAGRHFELRSCAAEGTKEQLSVRTRAVRGFWMGRTNDGPYLYFLLRLSEDERSALRKGRYALHVTSSRASSRFELGTTVTIDVSE